MIEELVKELVKDGFSALTIIVGIVLGYFFKTKIR